MNYTQAFSYVFDDQDWIKKILIAGLISLIPIVGWIYLLGWSVEIVRRTKAHRTDILPATHFSYFLTLGLKLAVVMLIYSIPFSVLSAITKGLSSQVFMNEESGIQILFFSSSCLSGFLGILLSIATAFLTGYGVIRLAETDQIKSCLEIGNAFDSISNNFKSYFLIFLVHFVIALIELAGILPCGIGLLFTVPYGFAVSGHLYGQLWDNLNIPEKKDKVYDATSYRACGDPVEITHSKKADDVWMPETVRGAAAAPVIMQDDAAVQETDIEPEDTPFIDTECSDNSVDSTDEMPASLVDGDVVPVNTDEIEVNALPEQASSEESAEESTAEDNPAENLPKFD